VSARSRIVPVAIVIAAWSTTSDVHAVREVDATALVNKILDCYAAEGGHATDRDRETVVALTETDDGRALLDAACPGLPESCAAIVATMRCDDLERHLVRAMPAAPTWASTFGAAVGARAAECMREERHDAPGGDALYARARALGDQVAITAGALVTQHECVVHAEKIDACVESLKARSCDAFAIDLLSLDDRSPATTPETDGAATAAGALRLCPALLVCGGDRPRIRFHRTDADATNVDGAATPGAR
jgi:hypothetical protein